jgi:hypothetical protein
MEPTTSEPSIEVTEDSKPEPSTELSPDNTPTRRLVLPQATTDGAPEWAKVPAGMKFPREKQIIFLRFKPEMTDTPSKGERQAILWSNNLGDQRLAVIRSDKDPNRMEEQMSKQMVRSVDGVVADWTGEQGMGNIDIWWDSIGPKCRDIINRLFIQLHIASQEETKYFFENCVAVRLVVG